jgi:translation elongation factor EF-Tu-like GTPase
MEGLGVDQVEASKFQFEIENAFLVEGKGTAVSGLVELGTVRDGEPIDIHGLHAKRHARIGAIVCDGERLDEAPEGHRCTLLLVDLTPGHIGPGMLATHAGGERRKDLRERIHREYSGASA